MAVHVLFFATLRDLARVREVVLALDTPCTVAEVRAAVSEQYPHMADNLHSALVAVNEEYAFDEETVGTGATVAFFPPVSGGQAELPEFYHLPYEAIDHDALIASITTPQTGAVALFSGLVRGETHREGHLPQTDYLEYEAYEAMALDKMRQVAREIRQQFPKVIGIALVQRLGKLAVGDSTVLIACSSPHRDDGCFEAARYGIDRLKEIVPVWKKEVSATGERWVEGSYQPTLHDRIDKDEG